MGWYWRNAESLWKRMARKLNGNECYLSFEFTASQTTLSYTGCLCSRWRKFTPSISGRSRNCSGVIHMLLFPYEGGGETSRAEDADNILLLPYKDRVHLTPAFLGRSTDLGSNYSFLFKFLNLSRSTRCVKSLRLSASPLQSPPLSTVLSSSDNDGEPSRVNFGQGRCHLIRELRFN